MKASDTQEIRKSLDQVEKFNEKKSPGRDLTEDESKLVQRFVNRWMDDHVNENDADPKELLQGHEEHSCIDAMLGTNFFDDHDINYDELDYDKLAKFVHSSMRRWNRER